jgi:hypothetical protein
MNGPRIHFRSDATPEHRERVRAALAKCSQNSWHARNAYMFGSCITVDGVQYSRRGRGHVACGMRWFEWCVASELLELMTENCPVCQPLLLTATTNAERAEVVRRLSDFPDALANMAVAADLAQHDGRVTPAMIAAAVLELADYRNPKDVDAIERACERSLQQAVLHEPITAVLLPRTIARVQSAKAYADRKARNGG